MNKFKVLSLILLSITIATLSSCKSEKEKQYDEILSQEKLLFGDRTTFNDSIARVYLNLVDSYIKQYNNDEHSPELLFKSGEVLNGLQSYSFAIRKFQEVQAKYPNYSKAAESIFLCGFIYDTHLQKYQDAERYYKMFIKKYPNHPLAKDAQNSIDNLGKSPEELIKEFEKKNQL